MPSIVARRAWRRGGMRCDRMKGQGRYLIRGSIRRKDKGGYAIAKPVRPTTRLGLMAYRCVSFRLERNPSFRSDHSSGRPHLRLPRLPFVPFFLTSDHNPQSFLPHKHESYSWYDCPYFPVRRQQLQLHENCGNHKTEADSCQHASPEPRPGLRKETPSGRLPEHFLEER
jgi:hypothetical protein